MGAQRARDNLRGSRLRSRRTREFFDSFFTSPAPSSLPQLHSTLTHFCHIHARMIIRELKEQEGRLYVSEQSNFLERAQDKTAPEPPVRALLEQAFSDPGTQRTTENDKLARSFLRKLGLEAVPTTSADEDSTSLDRFICANMLDRHNIHPGQAQSPSVQFQLKVTEADEEEWQIDIPCRSRLILWSLSQELKVDIYIFTNRSHPAAFLSPGSTRSLGFYNSIDSYFGLNKFYVLTAIANPPTPPEPAPSPTPLEPPEPAPPPTPQASSSYQAPPPLPIPCAVLREDRRGRTVRTNLKRLSAEESQQMMKKAW